MQSGLDSSISNAKWCIIADALTEYENHW